MNNVLLVLLAAAVIFWILRRSRNQSATKQIGASVSNTVTPIVVSSQEIRQARDFIWYAEGAVKDATGKSLSSLARGGSPESTADAINALIDTIKRGDDTERKVAYFALGQIGEEISLRVLSAAESEETKIGIAAAISGAKRALIEASNSKGFTEKDRRIIIEQEYFVLCNPRHAVPQFHAS